LISAAFASCAKAALAFWLSSYVIAKKARKKACLWQGMATFTSKKHLMKKFLLTLSLALAATYCLAQTADTLSLWRIETTDGNEYVGEIVSRDAESLNLRTDNLGVITIATRYIKSMKPIDPKHIVDGQFWAENSQATRYFFAPNGYGLKAGEAYYQNVWILFNQASIGLTDHLSLGVGMVPLFLFAGSATPVWLTPKVSVPIKKDVFNLGAGAFVGTVFGEELSGVFGIAYGTATFGSRDRNLSLGLGYGFADGGWASVPAINLSGMYRITKRSYLMGEGYLIESTGLMLLGGRSVWSKISLDYGLLLPLNAGDFVAIPWLGLVLPLGQAR
jgi:hypothetical protein